MIWLVISNYKYGVVSNKYGEYGKCEPRIMRHLEQSDTRPCYNNGNLHFSNIVKQWHIVCGFRVEFHTQVDVSERRCGVLERLSISLCLSRCTQPRTLSPSRDSMDYVQENVARGQTRNVITSGNDRYVAAIVG